jgi:hypothetical protein
MLTQLAVSAEQKRMTEEATRKVKQKVANEKRSWAATTRKKHEEPPKRPEPAEREPFA